MSQKLVSAVLVVILLLSLCAGSSGEGTTPTGPGWAMGAGAPLLVPSPCVVNALRILNVQRAQMLGERLKLDEGQKAKVADILAKSGEALKGLIEVQKRSAEMFVAGLTKPGLQAAEVQASADVAMKAEGAILTQRIKTLFALRAVLNPDQVNELNNMIDQTASIWRPGAPGIMHRFPTSHGRTPPTPPAQPTPPEPKPK